MLLNLPRASTFAGDIDGLVVLITILVGVWFFATQSMFFWLIWRFRAGTNPKSQYITGKEVNESKWGRDLLEAKELIFVPNAHFGPYMKATKIDENFYIYFGAHLPEGSDVRIPELDRAEIVSRLSALADDTRLSILQMIVENGEMRSQEIMEAVNMSQPSVSRYLSQLTAAGYLQERRENGAEVYVLNRDRVEKTLKAVRAFLLGRS